MIRIITFAALEKVAYIFLFIFATFLVVPSTVVLIKSSADVSFAYSVNEEENNSNQLELKEKQVKNSSNYVLSLFSENDKTVHFHDYKENYKHIFFDVLSPPPELV